MVGFYGSEYFFSLGSTWMKKMYIIRINKMWTSLIIFQNINSICCSFINISKFILCSNINIYVAIQCPQPLVPINGRIDGTSGSASHRRYAVGALVTFSCTEGHLLVGEASIVCTETGFWSHPPPFCKYTFIIFQLFIEIEIIYTCLVLLNSCSIIWFGYGVFLSESGHLYMGQNCHIRNFITLNWTRAIWELAGVFCVIAHYVFWFRFRSKIKRLLIHIIYR